MFQFKQTTFFQVAFFLIIICPNRSHFAYVQKHIIMRQKQEIVGDTKTMTSSKLNPDVEVFKNIENSPKTQILIDASSKSESEVKQSEPGFNLTKLEMDKFKIWPYGILPFFIDDYSFDTVISGRLRTLLNAINTVTGLRFMELTQPPKDEDEKWVFFINRRGLLSCEDYTSSSFSNKGVQRVVLGYDCLGSGGGALAPTVLALAGVPPQHNAPDRDRYINVVMENILPEKQHLFISLKDDEWLFHDIGYDFLSAGHYDFHKYTANGSATIVPKQDVTVPVGEGDGISYKDILKIKMLYNFIKRENPKAKASDCSKLYKPGVNFAQFEPEILSEDIMPRSKPEKYRNVMSANTDSPKKMGLQYISNMNKKKFNSKGKDMLEALQDYDTDGK